MALLRLAVEELARQRLSALPGSAAPAPRADSTASMPRSPLVGPRALPSSSVDSVQERPDIVASVG